MTHTHGLAKRSLAGDTKENGGMFFKTMNRKLNKDNSGLSLVELIVALLILTIIFTPTLTSFSMSLKLVTESRTEFYAENAAKNVMEVLKYRMGEGDNMTDVDGALATLAGRESTVEDPTFDGTEENPDNIVYTINNYTEGTQSFKVVVTLKDYEVSGKTAKENEKQFANMSAFSDTTTALINPSAVAGGYDESVTRFFATMNSAYFNSLYQDDLSWVNTHNNNVQEDYRMDCIIAELEGSAPPAAPTYISFDSSKKNTTNEAYDRAHRFLWTSPSAQTPLTDQEILAKLTKKMVINLNFGVTAKLDTQYILDSKMLYTLDNSAQICASTVTNPMECTGYCDNVYYADLNNIYILYTPLGSYPGSTISLSDEVIEITNTMERSTIATKTGVNSADIEPLNIFVVVQAEDGKVLDTTNTGLKIKVTGDGDCRPIKIYSQVNFNLEGPNISNGYSDDVIAGMAYIDSSDTTQKYSLITASKQEERIYDVDIKVYNSYGHEVYTLTSTITE